MSKNSNRHLLKINQTGILRNLSSFQNDYRAARNGIACMGEPVRRKKREKRRKVDRDEAKKIYARKWHGQSREALRHWEGRRRRRRRREERNKIRRNNEGAFWETVVREIKAENHVTAKSFERAYTTSLLSSAFFFLFFLHAVLSGVTGGGCPHECFMRRPPPTARLARTCVCPRFDTIPP